MAQGGTDCYAVPTVSNWMTFVECPDLPVFNSPQMPDSMRTAARPRPATSENKAEFATGLMIGKYHCYCKMLLDIY